MFMIVQVRILSSAAKTCLTGFRFWERRYRILRIPFPSVELKVSQPLPISPFTLPVMRSVLSVVYCSSRD
nr:MAG TPA: hypothetical protein [Bacteriophage sp.]